MYITSYFKSEDLNELVCLLGSIFNTSHDGLYVCDQHGYPLFYNDALLKISGVPEGKIKSSSIWEQIEMKILPNSAATVSLQQKRVHSTFVNYPNGKKALVTSTPCFDSKQEIRFIVSNVRDVTEINQLQQQLEETQRDNLKYQKELEKIQNELVSNNQFIYRSKKMHQILSLASRIAKNDSPILLLGESGVGKDVTANYIHEKSGRKGRFIKINCGAIPNDLLESELFGYEKGAFTGANTLKKGLFEIAHEGTVFLDEIGDLPYPMQVKLLNVLQDSKVRRIGGTETIEINTRIITATNLDLESLVEQKIFRLDLFYRLNVLSITIPPLRERPEDIPTIIFSNLEELGKKYKVKKTLDKHVLEKCMEYEWPGNIRELKNIVERMYHISENKEISLNELPSYIQNSIREQGSYTKKNRPPYNKYRPLKQAIADFEKEYISHILSQTQTMQECANILGVNISTLVRKKRNLEIK